MNKDELTKRSEFLARIIEPDDYERQTEIKGTIIEMFEDLVQRDLQEIFDEVLGKAKKTWPKDES